MNLPNYLTFSRLLISPIFILLYLSKDALNISQTTLVLILIALITFSEISDIFDGYLARKWGQITPLGKVLDPMADTMTHLTAFLTFTTQPVNLPIWIFFVFFYRDIVISALRTICALKGFALAARASGKLKTIFQAATIYIILGMMLLESYGVIAIATMQRAALATASLTAIYTIYSCIEYLFANKAFLASYISSEKT